MHRALQIPEIIHLICSYVGSGSDLSKQSQCRLALACRSFSGPAMEEIWSNLDSIEPLLDSMSPSLWDVDIHKGRKLNRRLKRSITPRDIQAFKQRAARVRRLSINITPRTVASQFKPLVFIYAAYNPFDGPAFPKLRSLTVYDITKSLDTDLTPLHLVLSPSLEELTMYHSSSTPGKLSFTTGLPYRSPNLTSLELACGELKTVHDRVALSDSIQLWHNLQRVMIHQPPMETLVALSRLPQLLEVKLQSFGTTGQLVITPSITAGSGGFPALRDLSFLAVKDLSCCYTALMLLRGTPLTRLTIQPKDRVSHTMLQAFLESLSTNIHCSSLLELVIGDEEFENTLMEISDEPEVRNELMQVRGQGVSDPYHLDALHPFHNLQKLTLSPGFPYPTPLHALKTLGTQLSHIRTLKLGDFTSLVMIRRPDIKLTDLLDIARCFPVLEKLSLAVDAAQVPLAVEKPGSGLYEHRHLQELYVGCSPMVEHGSAHPTVPRSGLGADLHNGGRGAVSTKMTLKNAPFRIAAWLTGVFPNLRVVSAGGDPEEGGEEDVDWWDKWEDVQEMMELLKVVRMQERMGMKSG